MILPRERIRMALNHEDLDRPPLDLGSTLSTTISKIAYGKLLDYLGIPIDSPPKVIGSHKFLQLVEVDEPVLERLHIDTRRVHVNPPDKDQSK